MSVISYVDLSAQWREEEDDLLPIIHRVLRSGRYIDSPEVEEFELEAALTFGVKYVVALNSGTDALVYGLAALGIQSGDDVITPPNSFVASTAAVVHMGARPVFVDVGPDQNIDASLIERAITRKTKAIMPIHLTGRVADMNKIQEVAQHYRIPIIEDAAQSVGSRFEGRYSGAWGKVGCFSAHPLKNLNACGDAGFITTNDKDVASRIRLMRNHGLVDRNTVLEFGHVSRMDTVQAAILRYRLSRLPDVVKRRRDNSDLYRSVLDPELVFHPAERSSEFNTWHTFVIQVDRRDALQAFLASRNIETAIHYPVPIHLQLAGRKLGYCKGDFPITENQADRILTLPIHQHLREDQIHTVAEAINDFFKL